MKAWITTVWLGVMLSHAGAQGPFVLREIFESGEPFPATSIPSFLPPNATLEATGATGIIDASGAITLRFGSNWSGVATLAYWDGQDVNNVSWAPLLTAKSPIAAPDIKAIACGESVDCDEPIISRIDGFAFRQTDVLVELTVDTGHRFMVAVDQSSQGIRNQITFPEQTHPSAVSSAIGFAPAIAGLITHNSDASISLRTPTDPNTVLAQSGSEAPLYPLPLEDPPVVQLDPLTMYNLSVFSFAFNGKGQAIFPANLSGERSGTTLYMVDESRQLTPLATYNHPHPDVETLLPAGLFQGISSDRPSINDKGEVCFITSISDPGGGTQPAMSLWYATIEEAEPRFAVATRQALDITGMEGKTAFTFMDAPLVTGDSSYYFRANYPAKVTVDGFNLDTTKQGLFRFDPQTHSVSLVLGGAEKRWNAGEPVPGIPQSKMTEITRIFANGFGRLLLKVAYQDADGMARSAILAQDPRDRLSLVVHEGQSELPLISAVDGQPTTATVLRILPFLEEVGTTVSPAYNGQDGRPTPFSDSGRFMLNLQMEVAGRPSARSYVVIADFDGSAPQPTGGYTWTGDAGTNDWHTVKDGVSNWVGDEGLPYSEPPGTDGDEEVFIESANVVIRQSAKIKSLEVRFGSFRVEAGHLEIMGEEDSQIENLTLQQGATLTTHGPVSLEGDQAKWEGGTLASEGEKGAFTVDGAGSSLSLTKGESNEGGHTLNGHLDVEGTLNLTTAETTLTVGPGGSLSVMKEGEVRQANSVTFKTGEKPVSIRGQWVLLGDAVIQYSGNQFLDTVVLDVADTGELVVDGDAKALLSIQVSPQIAGKLNLKGQLTLQGDITLPKEEERIVLESGMMIFQGDVVLEDDYRFDGGASIQFDLMPSHRIRSSQTDMRRNLSFWIPLEWKRGQTQMIDMEFLRLGSKITGEGVIHEGSLTIGTEISPNPFEVTTADFSIEGKNTILGFNSQGAIRVNPGSLLTIEETATIQTSVVSIKEGGRLEQGAVVMSTANFENSGLHSIGEKLEIKAPGNRYTLGDGASTRFRIEPVSERAMIVTDQLHYSKPESPGLSGASIDVGEGLRLECRCNTYSFYDSSKEELLVPPRISVNSGDLIFADASGAPIPIRKYGGSILKLFGQARFNAFPNLTDHFDFFHPVDIQNSEVSSLWLIDYQLASSSGKFITCDGAFLTLKNSKIFVGDGGSFSLFNASSQYRGILCVEDDKSSISASEIVLHGNVDFKSSRVDPSKKLTLTAPLVDFSQGVILTDLHEINSETTLDRIEITGTLHPVPPLVSISNVLHDAWRRHRGARLPLLTYTKLGGNIADQEILIVYEGSDGPNHNDVDVFGQLSYTANTAFLRIPDMKTFGASRQGQISQGTQNSPLGAPLGDLDNDTLTNIEEHFFGTSLNTPNINPVAFTQSTTPGELLLTFPMANDVTDVDVVIESGSGSSWVTEPGIELEPMPLENDRIQRRFRIQSGGKDVSLFRLRITKK